MDRFCHAYNYVAIFERENFDDTFDRLSLHTYIAYKLLALFISLLWILQHDLNPEESGMPAMIRCMVKGVQQNGVYLIGRVPVVLYVHILWTYRAWNKDLTGASTR